jgi:hypothetical protein
MTGVPVEMVSVSIPIPFEAVCGTTISIPGAATHLNVALWLRATLSMVNPSVDEYVGSIVWFSPASLSDAESPGSR